MAAKGPSDADPRTGAAPGQVPGAPRGKLRAMDPAALAARLRLPPRHQAVLDLWRAPDMLLGTLLELELTEEAMRLLACALPEREAVWWACMCAAHTAPEPLPLAECRALEAAEAWVRRPGRDTRFAAGRLGRRGDHQLPGHWAAAAASWSATRPASTANGAPALPGKSGRAVEVALRLAALRGAAGRRLVRLRRFVEGGRDIAAGGLGRLAREDAA